MKLAVAVTSCVAFLGTLAAFVILSLRGVDTTPLVAFIGGTLISVAGQIATLIKTYSIHSDVTTVKQQTNGPLNAMSQKITDIAENLNKGGNDAGSS